MLLVLLFLAELSAASLSYRYRANLVEQIYQGWIDSANDLRNRIQSQLFCCGFFNPSDYPGSACPASRQGCFEALQATLKRRLLVVSAGGFALAAIQLIAVLFAACLLAHPDEAEAPANVPLREKRARRKAPRGRIAAAP